MGTAKVTHDINLANVGATVNMGFMLAKDSKGRKMWDVGYAPPIAPQQTQGLPTSANLPVEQQITWQQDSWHGGLISENEYKLPGVVYCESGDTRWKGKVLMPPKVYTITTTARHTPVNYDFESWADAATLNSWTAGNCTTNREGTIKNAGSYSAKLTRTVGGTVGTLKQTNYLRGLGTVTFTVKVYQTTAEGGSLVRVGLKDSTGAETWGDYTATVDAWTDITVTKTFADASTLEEFWIQIKDQVHFAYVDTSSCTISSLAYTGVKFLEHKTTLLVLLSKALCKWDNTNAWWEVLRGAGTNSFTDVETFDGNIYLAHGTGGTFEYSADDGVTWNTSTLAATVDFDFFRSYANTLWAFKKPNNLLTSANPINDGTVFGSNVEIGDTTWNITGIAGLGASVYVGKESGVFKIDATPAVTELMPEFRTLQDADNFKGMYSWQGYLFLPVMGGLYVYDGATIQDISVTRKSVNSLALTHSTAMYNVLAGDSQWLYIFTTDAYFYALRLETIEGTVPETDWRWHLIYTNAGYFETQAGVDITNVYCSIVSKLQADTGRLWFWEKNTDNVYNASYIILPGLNPPDTSGSVAEFSTAAGYIYMPWWDYGFPEVSKAFLSLTIKVKGVTSGTGLNALYIMVYYAIDNGTLTFWGNITIYPQTLYLSNKTGKKIQIAFRFIKGDSISASTTLVLESIVLKADFRPIPLRMWNIGVQISDRIRLLNGAEESQSASLIATNLATLINETWPLTFQDIDGTSWSAKVIPNSYREAIVAGEPLRNKERVALMTLIESKTA